MGNKAGKGRKLEKECYESHREILGNAVKGSGYLGPGSKRSRG